MAGACNALLDNQPRELEPAAGGGGDLNDTSGSTMGGAGAAGGGDVAGAAGADGPASSGGATSTGGPSSGGAASSGGPTSTSGGVPTCTGVRPECVAGESELESEACACSGVRTRTKLCTDDCTWTLGDWGPCEGVECEPGARSQPEPCACDSGRSQTRSCTESCTWGPATGCDLGCGSAPASLPSTTSYLHIWTNAIGRSGTSNCCPEVGTSYENTNPQFVWCRSWGGLVSDDAGNYNHWWLWTEFDTPAGATGWISAYYVEGQGNDEANGIPDCP